MGQANSWSIKSLGIFGIAVLLALFIATENSWAINESPQTISTSPTKTAAKAKTNKPKYAPREGVVDFSYQDVSPLKLVADAENFKDKKVSFSGTFNSFDGYALDYKPALRSAKDYVAILIRRPDVTAHKIPLSELKLLFPRNKSKQVKDLESGDTIFVQGKVFSTALGDPWVDVEQVLIIEKSKEPKIKKAEKGLQ